MATSDSAHRRDQSPASEGSPPSLPAFFAVPPLDPGPEVPPSVADPKSSPLISVPATFSPLTDLPRAAPLSPPVMPGEGGRDAAAPSPPAAAPGRPNTVVGASGRPSDQPPEDSTPAEELSETIIRNAPPWLISAVVHMLLLIILGLWFFVIEGPQRTISLDSFTDVFAEKLGEQLQYDTLVGKKDVFQVEEPVVTPDRLPPVDDPFAAPEKLVDLHPNGNVASSQINAKQIGLALSGRREGSKQSLLGRYGGNRTTEEAVQRGLAWLARNQTGDGSWSLEGPYSDGAFHVENREAATAMALLAFQGNGQTPREGKYQRNVARAWNWLLKQQDADGNFFHEGGSNHRYYTHAMCTIALCELLSMTKNETYRPAADRAVENLLRGQSPEGGWRYQPQLDTDVSVTGWCVMALQSARMAGLAVPGDSFRRVERFLDRSAQHGGSRYPYQPRDSATLSMTAEALLIRQYLGWSRDDPRMAAGVKWLTASKNLVDYRDGRDVYYWYYATQVAHNMEGDYWKRWNAVMRQAVPQHQVKTGRESGSWDPKRPTLDRWGNSAGRLYVTCLSIYVLEVYYRHLPLYENIYDLHLPTFEFTQPSPHEEEGLKDEG
ncbi:MAG: terpene cyclase/mutase family protein [Pirellulales bacterium]|nr:terpene cyclase/mutase family protein [Pirellulales bacterium]